MVDRNSVEEGFRVIIKCSGDFMNKKGWIDQLHFEEDEYMILVELESGEKQPFKPENLETI